MISRLQELFNVISNRLPSSKIIYPNIDTEYDMIFGNFYGKVESSFDFQIERFNFHLLKLSQSLPNVFLININHLALKQNYYRDNRMLINYDIHFSIDFIKINIELTLKEILQK